MSNTNWNNNAIQFPRFIAELEATGALDFVMHNCKRVVDAMAESMDLDPSEVYEIVERASIEWDRIKSQTFAPAQASELPLSSSSRSKRSSIPSNAFLAVIPMFAQEHLLDPGTDQQSILRDMLTDCRHYADMNGLDFYAACDSSYQVYLEENQ